MFRIQGYTLHLAALVILLSDFHPSVSTTERLTEPYSGGLIRLYPSAGLPSLQATIARLPTPSPILRSAVVAAFKLHSSFVIPAFLWPESSAASIKDNQSRWNVIRFKVGDKTL